MTADLIKTDFEDLYLVKPFTAIDSRGSFSRLFSLDDLGAKGLDFRLAQANYSISDVPGTIRGLHYQTHPASEIKLIKVLSGRVYDVSIDIRKNSKTFMKAHCIELSSTIDTMVYIPAGFAHGLQSLDPYTQVVYFSSSAYSATSEGLIRWNDPYLDIKWPITTPILSDKDRFAPDLNIREIQELSF